MRVDAGQRRGYCEAADEERERQTPGEKRPFANDHRSIRALNHLDGRRVPDERRAHAALAIQAHERAPPTPDRIHPETPNAVPFELASAGDPEGASGDGRGHAIEPHAL